MGIPPYSSRAEFLTDSLNDNLKYSRNGGVFVTTKKAIAFVVVAILSLLIVVLSMYFYGPNRRLEMPEINDIEELINQTLQETHTKTELRLAKHVVPVNYRLWIHPILDEDSPDNFTFTGHAKILINCTEITNKIVLHIDDLMINESDISVSEVQQEIKVLETTNPENSTNETSVYEYTNSNNTIGYTEEVVQKEMKKLMIQNIVQDNENYRLTITLLYLMEAGHSYSVDIKFSGDILNNLKGLYKTSYVHLDGSKKWLATTHFQSVYARRAFPCFDEPYFKASFEISLAHRSDFKALSNMPLRDIEFFNDTDDWVWSHFMPTPPMSTYLVAFTISDFESNNSTKSSFPITVWAPQHDLTKTKYALEVVEEVVPFLEDYFGIPYPLPKLDLIAIPNLGREAMENWGIIYFRKATLLFDEDSRSIRSKSYIFNKIAHELAHQWFGNLVTMEWWSDLWLNEGFGTFMSEIVLTNLRPRWQLYSSLDLRDTYKTLYYDSLKSTHSIQTEIKNTEEIEQIFDTIIYQKGCSILRMLNHTFSRDVFRNSVKDYISKFAYKASDQNDLWEILTYHARNKSKLHENVTVKNLMDSWTTQSGYPLVTILRNYSSEIATLNQTKMSEDMVESESLWIIPINYITSDEANVTKGFLMENVRAVNLNLTSSDNDSWVLLNIDETGFYRVNYDLQNWKLLSDQLLRNPQKIPVYNRGQLIDDAFHLSNNGGLNYTVAFELTKYLNIKETNYIPWYSALRNLEEIHVIISNYEYSGLYENYILKLTSPMFDVMGPKDKAYDTQNEKLLRLHLVQCVCKLRYGPCISWARNQYTNWMNMVNPDEFNPIPKDYRFIAQCTAIKNGGINEWDFLWNRTLSTIIEPADLQTAYLSLGCTNDPWIINRYLEYSLSENITLENVQYVWKSISHTVGVRTGFQFLRLNWERIFDSYEDIYVVFSTIFHDFVSQLSTEIDLEDIVEKMSLLLRAQNVISAQSFCTLNTKITIINKEPLCLAHNVLNKNHHNQLTTFYKLHQNDLKTVSTVLQSTVDQIKLRINWKSKHLHYIINWLKENKI